MNACRNELLWRLPLFLNTVGPSGDVPQHGSFRGSSVAYGACLHREIPAQFRSFDFTEEFRRADIRLLSRPCTLWKHSCFIREIWMQILTVPFRTLYFCFFFSMDVDDLYNSFIFCTPPPHTNVIEWILIWRSSRPPSSSYRPSTECCF